MRLDRATTRARHTMRSAFSLIELMVVVMIVGILIALILVAVNHAGSGVRQSASQASVSAIAQAVRLFDQQFGFPPPLVQDGLQGSGGAMDMDPPVIDRAGTYAPFGTPVIVPPGNDRIRMAVVYNPAYEPNRRFLGGVNPAGAGVPSDQDMIDQYDPDEPAWLIANQRYSKYSLGYYLAGALPASVDGVDGPGMARPLADGSFEGVVADSTDEYETAGRSTSRDRHEAFFDPDRGGARLVREYFDLDEYREITGEADLTVNNPASETDWRHVAIVDSNDRAFRYYRWEPLSSTYSIDVTATFQLGIPWVLLDDEKLHDLLENQTLVNGEKIDLTNGDASLRNARWAVVGAGADGLFGTEPIAILKERLNMARGDFEDWEIRASAKADNAVEVGR